MVKLSDYLDYLYQEVVLARKKVDEQSVALAKAYAQDDYLKYFRVPRFTIPNVKLELPIKIDALDAETKYNFKMDIGAYLVEVNKKIEEVNRIENLTLKPVTVEQLQNTEFENITEAIEKLDHESLGDINQSINEIDFTQTTIFTKPTTGSTLNILTTDEGSDTGALNTEEASNTTAITPPGIEGDVVSTTPGGWAIEDRAEALNTEGASNTTAITPPGIEGDVVSTTPGGWTMEGRAEALNTKALDTILKESLRNQFIPVSSKLNNIFIDPDTTKESDKDKILLKLNVEMVEEGLRIVNLQDENGKEFEEIVFE